MPDQETAVTFWKMLLEGGLYLNLALPPATPTNVRLLRTSVSAAHTTAQIDTALEIFADVGRRLGFLQAAVAAPERRARLPTGVVTEARDSAQAAVASEYRGRGGRRSSTATCCACWPRPALAVLGVTLVAFLLEQTLRLIDQLRGQRRAT